MGLTAKKKAFADAVLAGKTKTAAAIEVGLSAATAAQAGCRMAKDKEVQKYISEAGWKMATQAPAPVQPAAATPKKKDANWPFGTSEPEGPKKPEVPAAAPCSDDPLQFLLDVMKDPDQDPRLRVQAAIQATPYYHAKKGDAGKKAAKDAAAKKVAGRFSAGAPPKLVASGGKVV